MVREMNVCVALGYFCAMVTMYHWSITDIVNKNSICGQLRTEKTLKSTA